MTVSYTFRDDELIPAAMDLFHKLYKKEMPVRLLGVRLTDFASHGMQGNLFEDSSKKANLYKAIDDVKNKFGKLAVNKARTVPQPKKDEPGKEG